MIAANRLIPAKTAVEALCNVEDDQVSQVLGFPLITKAEPYTAKALPFKGTNGGLDSEDRSASVGWLITAVVISSTLAVAVLLALLFLIHRQKQVQ